MGEPASHEKELVLNGHVSGITAISFSWNGFQLATGCSRGWLNVWSLQVLF